jgi:hypothetical protein
MKVKKLNTDTAVDEVGISLFKKEIETPHRTWPTCPCCKRRVNLIWVRYPITEEIICDTCVDWEE